MILSILIPTYNRSKYLEKNINLLSEFITQAKLDSKVEVVISNNCSPDNTDDIIENFIEYYTGVTLKQLFKDYKTNISKLQLQFPNANIHLSTIYYPKKEPYTYYHDTIKSWNDMIISYAKNMGFNVLRIDKYFKKKKDFTQSIEPSIKGSKIILNTIQENLV